MKYFVYEDSGDNKVPDKRVSLNSIQQQQAPKKVNQDVATSMIVNISEVSAESYESQQQKYAVKSSQPERILTALYRNILLLVDDYNVTAWSNNSQKESLDKVFHNIIESETVRLKGNKKLVMLCVHSLNLLKVMQICPNNKTPIETHQEMIKV